MDEKSLELRLYLSCQSLLVLMNDCINKGYLEEDDIYDRFLDYMDTVWDSLGKDEIEYIRQLNPA